MGDYSDFSENPENMSEDKEQPIGNVIYFNSNLGLGLAMCRLNVLNILQSNSRVRCFIPSALKEVNVRLFKPSWWPQDFDYAIGKPR